MIRSVSRNSKDLWNSFEISTISDTSRRISEGATFGAFIIYFFSLIRLVNKFVVTRACDLRDGILFIYKKKRNIRRHYSVEIFVSS